ncbi:MAG TPA: hypothetical protein VNY84_07385 [Acidimicrobiales bacterium]|nr:hypothetical protein [Acidimicrobiales bacterium]
MLSFSVNNQLAEERSSQRRDRAATDRQVRAGRGASRATLMVPWRRRRDEVLAVRLRSC